MDHRLMLTPNTHHCSKILCSSNALCPPLRYEPLLSALRTTPESKTDMVCNSQREKQQLVEMSAFAPTFSKHTI